jgi:hypothetical protein
MMTKNEETLAAFAEYHQRHCDDSKVEVRAEDNVFWIRCSVCHGMLSITFKNHHEHCELATALMLNFLTPDSTVQ